MDEHGTENLKYAKPAEWTEEDFRSMLLEILSKHNMSYTAWEWENEFVVKYKTWDTERLFEEAINLDMIKMTKELVLIRALWERAFL